MSDAPHDFAPSADWHALRLRAELLRRLRAFFAERDFLEVETPLLSADTVVDRHLDPLAVTLPDDVRTPHSGRSLWLQTSPEFHMKRLMAAGGEALFQVTRSFRAGECGRLHNAEFTIVEWYRRGDTMHDGMMLLSELAGALLQRGQAEMISYRDVFLRHAGVDPFDAGGTGGLPARVGEARDAACGGGTGGLSARVGEVRGAERRGGTGGLSARVDRDAILDQLLVDRVEPHLGRDRPTIMFDYPASQAALAVIRDDDPPVAERFELYVDGVELANGYHELCDAAELRRRNALANAQRVADGKPPLPESSRLLAAMAHGLPACTGVALGFDRLAMVAAGADRLDRVMPFPVDRA